MDELLAAVEECTGRKISDVEKDWLRDLYHHVEKNVVKSSSGDISSSEVTLAVVDQVLSTTPGKELPLSFSFISVEQLVQSQHQACCSHLSTVNQREGTNISTIDTPVRPLDHIRALLLGRLTSGPNSLSVGRNNRAGQLYVEDNTGVVLCETLTFKANIFEELVFLPSWNYIPLSSHKQGNKGYLELTAPPCRLIKTCKVKEQDLVVLVPVAATILKNRKGKATKVISIQGRVSELSTILRVKEVVFFMFKLSCPAEQQHIPVIIKGPKLIHLYHLLEPRRDYIITGLKPTTLFKGSADSRNVYCSTSGTQVLPQSTEPQTVASLLSVLSASAVPVGSDGGTSETHTCSHGGGVRQKFCSYQGTITACVNSDVGIYQLDGKVRLHLGYQLHVSEGRGLRVGACVAVYNAHLVKEHTQGDAVCLSCCTASCVVIQSFSTLNSPYKPPSSHSAALKHLIYHLNPNLYELSSLLTAVRQLRLKFSSPIISGVVTSLFQQPSPVTGRLVLPQRQRNIYTEFLAEQHCCAPLAGLSSVTKMPPFQVPTVHELLQLAQQQAEMEQNWARHSSFTSSDPSNALCWTYMVLQPEHFNPPLLLVSQLTCSRHSGELQLEDNTGRVACVISQSTEAPSYPHLCTNACQSSGKPLVLVNSCPFVHPWNLNWLIRVDRYQLVVERFMHAKNENLASDQSDHKDFMTGCYIRISVQFSMCDVVNLYKVKRAGRLKHGPGVKMLDQVSGNTAGDLPTKKCEIENPNSHRKRKGLETEVSKSCKVACEDPKDQSARIYTAKEQSASHREDVCSAPRTDPISSKHQFPLCQPSSSSDNKRDDQAAPQGLELQNQQYVCQNFFLVHKDYPVVQQSADRKVTQGFYSSGLFLGNAVVGENSLRQQHDVNAGEGRNMMEAIKEVAVLFTGDAVQWYTVMHEGCLYRLVCPDSTDPAVFATKVSSAALNRAVDATNCRTCVVLPTGVFVEVLSEHRKDLCASRLDPVLSVEDLCKTKSSLHSRLISLSCSLVSCKYDVKHPNDGSSKPLSSSHKLAISSMVVQDLNSPFYTMTIYANFLAVPYALGLLPGAVLTLRRLEVRLSKKNKMYCYFNSSSSVRVEALSHRDMKESITTGPSAPTSLDNLQNIPKVFLGQLINSEAKQQVMVKVICQVVCIRYLYMQYTCSSCGQIFSNGQCQNRPCTSSSSDPGHFTAKASFLVDDGTGTAHVHCQQDVIGGVLGLTDDHWNILKRQAQKKGRLALRESGWGNNEWVADGDGCESPVESLLTSLCESLLVRRHVQLYCQITSTVHSSNSNSGKDYPVVTLEVGGVQYLTHIHPAVHLCCLKSVG